MNSNGFCYSNLPNHDFLFYSLKLFRIEITNSNDTKKTVGSIVSTVPF